MKFIPDRIVNLYNQPQIELAVRRNGTFSAPEPQEGTTYSNHCRTLLPSAADLPIILGSSTTMSGCSIAAGYTALCINSVADLNPAAKFALTGVTMCSMGLISTGLGAKCTKETEKCFNRPVSESDEAESQTILAQPGATAYMATENIAPSATTEAENQSSTEGPSKLCSVLKVIVPAVVCLGGWSATTLTTVMYCIDYAEKLNACANIAAGSAIATSQSLATAVLTDCTIKSVVQIAPPPTAGTGPAARIN